MDGESPPGVSAKVDALLFDLGGVIVEIDWDRAFSRWAADSGASVDELRRRYAFDAPYERHERGEIEAPEYFASLRRSLAIDLTDAQFAAGWNALFGAEITETVELLRTVKGRLPLHAFSNTNVAHRRFWSKRFESALRVFDRIFVSCELGAMIARAIGTASLFLRRSQCDHNFVAVVRHV